MDENLTLYLFLIPVLLNSCVGFAVSRKFENLTPFMMKCQKETIHIIVYRLILLPMLHLPTLCFGFDFVNMTQQSRMLSFSLCYSFKPVENLQCNDATAITSILILREETMHILVYLLVLLPMRHPSTLYFWFDFMNLTQQARMQTSVACVLVSTQ